MRAVSIRYRGRQREHGEVSRVRAILDIESYVDSGLVSGLVAMSERRELLDEIYGNLGDDYRTKRWHFERQEESESAETSAFISSRGER